MLTTQMSISKLPIILIDNNIALFLKISTDITLIWLILNPFDYNICNLKFDIVTVLLYILQRIS